jgi:hypothetical protein
VKSLFAVMQTNGYSMTTPHSLLASASAPSGGRDRKLDRWFWADHDSNPSGLNPGLGYDYLGHLCPATAKSIQDSTCGAYSTAVYVIDRGAWL